jgi:hypothetical protein
MSLAQRAAAITGGFAVTLLMVGATPAAVAGRQALKVSSTPEQLAEQVSEVRVFLTGRPDEVIGEITVVGDTTLKELVVPMEQQNVRFADDGIAPDRRAGDRIFTAKHRMDIRATFKQERAALVSSSEALTGDGKAWVRRGPRDNVPAETAWLGIQAAKLPGFDKLADRTRVLQSTDDPFEAAKRLGVDFKITPFMIWPTARFVPPAKSPHRMFDVSFFPGFFRKPPPIPIGQSVSLMITNVGVVEDVARTYDACTNTGTPGGVWSFGHLMRELSENTGLTPEDFALQWLANWQSPQTVNGWLIDEPARAAQLQTRIIDSWQRLSGPTLNVDKFPARLLAIVNRPDLADRIGYGKSGSAGEGRFAFGLLEKPVGGGACNFLSFTVIFEYGIKGGSCSAVKTWHQRWKDLEANPTGSAAYNAALEAITLDFTEAGTNAAQLPNQSSLNQLRTNEIALGTPWQLREFKLRPAHDAVPAGMLGLVTTAQTPDGSVNGTTTLAQYLVDDESDILNDRHVVPETYPTALDPFRGARSHVANSFTTVFWNTDLTALADPAETRRKFSLNTCNGCHGGETATVFTHLGQGGRRAMGNQAERSDFLTGGNPFFNVPVTGGSHLYDDLEEREAKMSDILTASCTKLLAHKRPPFAH